MNLWKWTIREWTLLQPKQGTSTNTKVTKENEDHFGRYQSWFLEAPLVRQADGEHKNTLEMKLPTVFDMENCSERTAARR